MLFASVSGRCIQMRMAAKFHVPNRNRLPYQRPKAPKGPNMIAQDNVLGTGTANVIEP